jgi:hypothetical protein
MDSLDQQSRGPYSLHISRAFVRGSLVLRVNPTASDRQTLRGRRLLGAGLVLFDFGELLIDVTREHELRGTLAIERNLGRHLALGLDAADHVGERLERVLEGVLHRGRLETRMDHAVGALLVIADAVGVPIGALHQLLEGLGVAFAEQIAGLLPAEHGAGRIAPRRAVIGLVAGQEVEEQAGLAERPSLAAVAALEDVAEQLLGGLAIEEVLLIRRARKRSRATR